jgi:hypothetical protein
MQVGSWLEDFNIKYIFFHKIISESNVIIIIVHKLFILLYIFLNALIIGKYQFWLLA